MDLGLKGKRAVVTGATRGIGRAIAELLAEEGCDLGSVVSDGAQREHIPALQVNAVDATGAGDCYCGATLARLALGDSIWQASRYANVAAALATTGFGAVAPLPRPEAAWRALAIT